MRLFDRHVKQPITVKFVQRHVLGRGNVASRYNKGESQFSVLPLPLPLPISFAHSRESKGCPNSGWGRGVGVRGRGRYPLKPSIFASLLETKGYPEHTSARSSRESHKCKYFRRK